MVDGGRGVLVVAVALAVTAVGGPAWAQEEAAPATGVVVTDVSVESSEDSLTVRVSGTADVPKGALVRVGVELSGQFGKVTRAEVADGKWLAVIGPIEQLVVPGEYTLHVGLAPKQPRHIRSKLEPERLAALRTPSQKTVQLGDPAQAEAVRSNIRQKLFDYMEELRVVFLNLSQYETYFNTQAKLLKAQNDGKVPAGDARNMRRNWERAVDDFWDQRFVNLTYEWKDHKAQIFIHPFPDGVSRYEAFLVVIRKWYAAAAGELAKHLGMPPPKELVESGGTLLDRDELRVHVTRQAMEFYKALGAKGMPQWRPFDGTQRERGRLIGADKSTYQSFVAKFQVTLPNPSWQFDFRAVHPTSRLRMRPGDDLDQAVKSGVVAMVEIRDYAQADSFEDLSRRSKLYTPNRFAGYKEISLKDIKVDDSSMPGGKRLGLVKTFITTEDGRTFWVRKHELFCRWYKRTYSVLCVVPEGGEADVEEALDAICASFKILDAPQFQQFKDEERERMRERQDEQLQPAGEEDE